MRSVFTTAATVIGRGFTAAPIQGCLPMESAPTRTLSPTTPHLAAVPTAAPTSNGVGSFGFHNDATRKGTHPPRAKAQQH